MLTRLEELHKTCATLVGFLLFYFILAQSGKILAQFLCKTFILFCFILLQMGEPLKRGFTVRWYLQARPPKYLVDCCKPTSDVASYQHLRSAGGH